MHIPREYAIPRLTEENYNFVELADALGLTHNTVRHWINAGCLVYKTRNRIKLIPYNGDEEIRIEKKRFTYRDIVSFIAAKDGWNKR